MKTRTTKQLSRICGGFYMTSALTTMVLVLGGAISYLIWPEVIRGQEPLKSVWMTLVLTSLFIFVLSYLIWAEIQHKGTISNAKDHLEVGDPVRVVAVGDTHAILVGFDDTLQSTKKLFMPLVKAAASGLLNKDDRIFQSACDFISKKAEEHSSRVNIRLSEKKQVTNGFQGISLLFRASMPSAFVGPGWIMSLDVSADCGDWFCSSIHQHMEKKFGRTPEEEEAKILEMIEPVWARSSYKAYKIA
jgi:hypothetical protein